TFDYTHRLLDPALATGAAAGSDSAGLTPCSNARSALGSDPQSLTPPEEPAPHVTRLLNREGLIEPNAGPDDGEAVGDITRDPIAFPSARDRRLQALARGDEGFLLALGYSTQRGYGRTHPFASEIRMARWRCRSCPRSWASRCRWAPS